MKQITELKKIGKGERYKLFLDEEFVGIYEAEILARHCLKTGQSFDEKFFDALAIENGDYACFNRGLNAIEKSMKTKKMLRDYLREKGYPISCIDRACEKLEEYGYINDENFCESYIHSYKHQKSKRKLKYDLLSKGAKEDIIDCKLDEILDEESEDEKCLRVADKYLRNKEFDLKTKQKFYNHMAGKGFEFGQIAKVWEKITNGRD
ncbi:MAG: regulatory protein RecX [Clostridiales bacterium]|nr:regulatory protein RecX [Clostridiales bacterium]